MVRFHPEPEGPFSTGVDSHNLRSGSSLWEHDFTTADAGITGDPLAVLEFAEPQLIDTRPEVARTAPIVTG